MNNQAKNNQSNETVILTEKKEKSMNNLVINYKLTFGSVTYGEKLNFKDASKFNSNIVIQYIVNQIDGKIQAQNRINELGGKKSALNVGKNSRPEFNLSIKHDTNIIKVAKDVKLSLSRAGSECGTIKVIRKDKEINKKVYEFNKDILQIILTEQIGSKLAYNVKQLINKNDNDSNLIDVIPE